MTWQGVRLDLAQSAYIFGNLDLAIYLKTKDYFMDRLFRDYSVITSHNDEIVSWIISGESAVMCDGCCMVKRKGKVYIICSKNPKHKQVIAKSVARLISS